MAKTTTELLDEVEAAISKALLAQSYTAGGGRSKTNAHLDALFRHRDTLKKQLALETGTGGPAKNVGVRRRS